MDQKTRPDVLNGSTYKIKAPNNTGDIINIYLIINNDEAGHPFEVFIRCDDPTLFEHITAVTLLASAMLRRNINLHIIAEILKGVHSPTTSHFMPGTRVLCPSLYARIGEVFIQHAKNYSEVKCSKEIDHIT